MIDLDELERLYAAATAGEWHAANRGVGYEIHRGKAPATCWGPGPDCGEINNQFRDTFAEDDARAIAAWHNAAPAILAELRAGRAFRAAHSALAKLPHAPEDVAVGCGPGCPVWDGLLRALIAYDAATTGKP